jgi:HD-GYP domain-containing protein (c-di-GMP phosphodiesterase class II)
MMSDTLFDEGATLSRKLLAEISPALYKALPSARTTVGLCSEAVTRAVRVRKPRIVREWLAYEQSTIAPAKLIECLDAALALEARDVHDPATLAFMQTIRSEAVAFKNVHATPVGIDPTSTLIEGMHIAIEAFDERLARHSADVAALATRLAEEADLSAERVTLVDNASRVHEIARLQFGRPAADVVVLTLDDRQRREMRAALGRVPMLRRHEALEPIADVVTGMYLHDSLVASDEANIVRVADAFISMCEPRPHRKPILPHDALTLLRRDSGSLYDSRYVSLLVGVLNDNRYARSA